MRRVRSLPVLAMLISFAAALLPATSAGGQGIGCDSVGEYAPTSIGTPNAEGTTLQLELGSPADRVGVQFSVAQVSAASLYVGDQWYDLDLYLYARGRCPEGRWNTLVRAWSVRAERRVLQFMRPDEQIVNLPVGDYVLLAQAKQADDPEAPTDFDPTRGFTVRAALNTPYCGIDPPDQQVPHPSLPSIVLDRRPDEALYQLGLLVDPPEASERGPFSLLTFTAFVSPPYIDLFDFVWQVDGQTVPGVNIGTLQIPAADLPRLPGGQHKVRVTGIGAREYPDPWLTHTPPTLTVECNFRIAQA